MKNIFGWSLPPGCGTLPDEEQLCPPKCEECEDYNDENQTCPYGSWGDDNVLYEKCPKISMIMSCDNCNKLINKVIADIPKENTATLYDVNYCCSEKCANELQKKFDKEIEEMKMIEKQK